MTLPDERYRAVLCAKYFLQDLAMDKEKFPRIPKRVRQQALSILKHYPTVYDMKELAEAAPTIVSDKRFSPF